MGVGVGVGREAEAATKGETVAEAEAAAEMETEVGVEAEAEAAPAPIWTATMHPAHNKYIKNFGNIRIIQRKLIKGAQRCLIPQIDNTCVSMCRFEQCLEATSQVIHTRRR